MLVALSVFVGLLAFWAFRKLLEVAFLFWKYTCLYFKCVREARQLLGKDTSNEAVFRLADALYKVATLGDK